MMLLQEEKEKDDKLEPINDVFEMWSQKIDMLKVHAWKLNNYFHSEGVPFRVFLQN